MNGEMEEERLIYVKIPKKNVEKTYNTHQNIKTNSMLECITKIPTKNLTNKQVGILIQSNNYIEVKTENIFTDFIKLGNYIDKATRKISINDLKAYSVNTYVEKFFQSNFEAIKEYSFKEKDDNDNLVEKTIDLKMKELMKKYEYETPKILDFYIFIYEIWEITHLRKNYYGGFNRLSYLYSKYRGNSLKNDFWNKLKYFLKKYEAFSSFKFHIEEHEDDMNPFDMFLASEELKVPLMFECLNDLSAIEEKAKYTICSVDGCNNLFRKTQKNNSRCNTPECTSERVKQYQ